MRHARQALEIGEVKRAGEPGKAACVDLDRHLLILDLDNRRLAVRRAPHERVADRSGRGRRVFGRRPVRIERKGGGESLTERTLDELVRPGLLRLRPLRLRRCRDEPSERQAGQGRA